MPTDEESLPENRSNLKVSLSPGKRKKRRHRYRARPSSLTLSLGHTASESGWSRIRGSPVGPRWAMGRVQ